VSAAAAQATAFYREVARTRRVWTIRDDGGFPAPKNSRGTRAQPFWSSPSRVERILKNVAAYRGFRSVELTWEDFRDNWLAELEADGMAVGVNWSGKTASGYDLEPRSVREAITWQIEHPQASA
jgi:hypothetical protein